MNKIGETTKVEWYRFENDELWFSFHVAFLDKERKESTILLSSLFDWPSSVAEENKINYTYMRNATSEEVEDWLSEHPNYRVAEKKEMRG